MILRKPLRYQLGGFTATTLQAEGPNSDVQRTASHLSNNPK